MCYYMFNFLHNLYAYACIIFCSSNLSFFCLLCSVVYTCVTVYATSLYNVNKLVTTKQLVNLVFMSVIMNLICST